MSVMRVVMVGMVGMVMMTKMMVTGEDDNMLLIFDLNCILVMWLMWVPYFTI